MIRPKQKPPWPVLYEILDWASAVWDWVSDWTCTDTDSSTGENFSKEVNCFAGGVSATHGSL